MQVEGALLDGMVCLASCDKTAPGQMMAAGRLNVPTLCAFTQQHRRFLIFLVRPSWAVPKLLEDGAEVKLVGFNAKGYSWLSVALDAPSGC